MTPEERIEAAARAMFEARMAIWEVPEGSWAKVSESTKARWRSLGARIVADTFPELHGPAPTHWLAPVEATEDMARHAEGFTDFYKSPAVNSVVDEWRLGYRLMRDAYTNRTGSGER